MRRTYTIGIYLITFCWGLYYYCLVKDMRLLVALASGLGSVVGIAFIPHVISVLTIRTGVPNYANRRFNRFVILWAVVMLLQLIVYTNEK